MITLCKTCGTSYDGKPERCPICEDERQYVPVSGQAWIDYATVTATHVNKWQQLEPALFSIKTVPAFAINQRALLLRTPHGNILWDCIANLDPATQTLIAALGGLHAIAISHPHYYTTMQEWAAAFDAPVYLHASDREWVMRNSPAIHFWEGRRWRFGRPSRCYVSAAILRAERCCTGRRARAFCWRGYFAGHPGKDAVSFMWSYPNMLPLPARTVEVVTRRLAGKSFARLYGAFEGQNIPANADDIVQRSGQKYIACLR